MNTEDLEGGSIWENRDAVYGCIREPLPPVHWCWNCDALLDWGRGLCLDCVRAAFVGMVTAAVSALVAWLVHG